MKIGIIMNSNENKTRIVKPFVKWAGGKSQLLSTFEDYLPLKLKNGKVQKYFEPFIGSGAVFFYVKQKYPKIKDFYISDINEELITVYLVIQNKVDKLIKYLSKYSKDYIPLLEEERKAYYYKMRENFNNKRGLVKIDKLSEKTVERAAQFIFLNRTCFNGLFRVNRSGDYNVPMGRYKKPGILDEENLHGVSELLKGVHITCGKYSDIKELTDSKSFVYFDPPYRPINKTSNFTSYSKYNFSDEEQVKLAEFYRELDKKESLLMLSNSDPKNVDQKDNFFDDLYEGFNVKRIQASRIINSKSDKRGKISELLIINY